MLHREISESLNGNIEHLYVATWQCTLSHRTFFLLRTNTPVLPQLPYSPWLTFSFEDLKQNSQITRRFVSVKCNLTVRRSQYLSSSAALKRGNSMAPRGNYFEGDRVDSFYSVSLITWFYRLRRCTSWRLFYYENPRRDRIAYS